MTFEELLDEALAMIQRRGRVTYNALQLQFELDDNGLDALKDELLFAHSELSDEEGRGLVWTGVSPPQVRVPPPETVSETALHETSSSQSELPPRDIQTPDAERRQLTVMFCDLVGSTQLSAQLDPEDLRVVVQLYQQTAAEAIGRYDGYIAQYLGDGLLVYFGYPQAHEDDAQRAVRAGLDLLDAMGPLNTELEQTKHVQLAVRMAIHTGLVVIGNIGGGERPEQLALGETPNIAARLEGLAAVNQIVLSASTRRLLGQTFALEDLGLHTLKGLPESIQVYGIVGAAAIESRFEAAALTSLTPLVGREEEIGLLLRRWDQAKSGEAQVVLLSGEPGIGKSRTVQAVLERIQNEPHLSMRYQCSPYHTNTALYPITEQLASVAGFTRADTSEDKLDKLEAHLEQVGLAVGEVAPLFAAALSLATGSRYAPLNLTPQQQKDRTIAALVERLLALAGQQPLLLIAEDLHWSDPTSLDTLGQMIERSSDARLLMIGTHRPECVLPWSYHGFITTLSLNRLSRSQSTALATKLTTGKALPPEVVEEILAKSEGIPLFIEEVTKSLLESGWLEEKVSHYELAAPLSSLTIPPTLQDALMSRLDRLAEVKELAQIGATIGREFSYALLRDVAALDETTLQGGMEQLVQSELCYQRGELPEAVYIFKHALIQDAAYQSLLKSTRQQYHQRIGQVLAGQFPEIVTRQPELIAHHYTEAGLQEQAVMYWKQAGERAIERSANAEAITHLKQGLALLAMLPETPARLQHELDLQVALGPALIAHQGYAAPDVERTYSRARELCERIGNTPQLFPALWGLWVYYGVNTQYHVALDLAEQLLSLAQDVQDPDLLLQAHHSMWMTLYHHGELTSVRTHCEQGNRLYDPGQHHAQTYVYGNHDPGVCARGFGCRALWILGYPDQARQMCDDMLSLARQLNHPISLIQAHGWAKWVHAFCGEYELALEQAEVTVTLATEQGVLFGISDGMIMCGWLQARAGEIEAGEAQIRQGLEVMQSTRAGNFLPWCLSLLAEVQGKQGQIELGLQTIASGLESVDEHEIFVCQADLYRVKGDLLLRQSPPAISQAESCFHQAMDIARHQEAKSWELRAATSLARLWQSQDKRRDAYDLLAPVYDWFTEGFDTADLIDAKALLDELEGSR